MGVLKSKHGVYYVRKKVPDKLAEAVSSVIGSSRRRVSWLKRSLHTKDLREANIKAKPALIEFDNILARADALLTQVPVRADMSEHEIEKLAAYHYASLLDEDEEVRREGTAPKKSTEPLPPNSAMPALEASHGSQRATGPPSAYLIAR
jgi:hypothetical protein